MTTVVLFTLLSTVPPDYAGVVRAAFHRWAAYQAFEVKEAAGPDAIEVTFDDPTRYWKYATSKTLGLAFSKAWGHERNLIVIRPREWQEDDLMAVLMHESAHILLAQHSHSDRITSVLYRVLRPGAPVRLDWDDLMRLREEYSAVKPIPQNLAGANRP